MANRPVPLQVGRSETKEDQDDRPEPERSTQVLTRKPFKVESVLRLPCGGGSMARKLSFPLSRLPLDRMEAEDVFGRDRKTEHWRCP